MQNMPAERVIIASKEIGSLMDLSINTAAISSNRVDPAMPYNSDIPYNKIAEEKAPRSRYFNEASFDRWLLRRKPTRTYVEMAVVSRPIYRVTRSTAPA